MSELKKAAAFWRKKAKDGKDYLSGIVEEEIPVGRMVIFQNGYKKLEKHPDYIGYIEIESDDKPEENTGAPF